MSCAAQNWAMPIFQSLDEGQPHELLNDYNAFREAVIVVCGEIDRKSTAEDRLRKIRQTGSVSTYISMFSECAAQVDWNEPSLVARFCGGLKEDILDSVATAENQPHRLHEWMLMASRIDECLWSRRQNRCPSVPVLHPRDHADRFHAHSRSAGSVPMEIDATSTTTAMATTAADRLEYQR